MHSINSKYSDYISLFWVSLQLTHWTVSIGIKNHTVWIQQTATLNGFPCGYSTWEEPRRIKGSQIKPPKLLAHWCQSSGINTWMITQIKFIKQHFFISEIRSGFRLSCKASSSTLKSSRKNFMSTLENPEAVEEYLATELRQSHIAGPFKNTTVPNGHISRFGMISKKTTGKWR